MTPSRRSLLRAFLVAPVAMRLAPFLKPAPEYIASAGFTAEKLRSFFLLFNERFTRTAGSVAALDWASMAEAGRLLPDPPLLVSPSVHAALTEGKPLPPEPTEFYEGNFFVDGNER